jgi:hypothetical protein
MIRDVVLHLKGEQPLLADLEAVPTSMDNQIICTNLRLMNGSRPIFVDDSASTFVFPVDFVRFVEIPPKALAGFDRTGRGDADRATLPVVLVAGPGGSGARSDPDDAGGDGEAEIDEDFLRRIRDV